MDRPPGGAAGSRPPLSAAGWPVPDLVVDLDAYLCSWRGQEVPLPRQCFRLLVHLTGNPGRVWTRDQLMDRCWPARVLAEPKTVDVHVRWLREALAAVEGCRIVTVRGVGYRFDWEPSARMREVFPRDRKPAGAPRDRANGRHHNPGLSPNHPWRHDRILETG